MADDIAPGEPLTEGADKGGRNPRPRSTRPAPPAPQPPAAPAAPTEPWVEYRVARALLMGVRSQPLDGEGNLGPEADLCFCHQSPWERVPPDSHTEACRAAHEFCFPTGDR